MMEHVYKGNLTKMSTTLGSTVLYSLRLGGEEIFLNDVLGREIKLSYLHQINCLDCGALTPKSFAQGYCYKCLISSPFTEDCVLRPDTCQAHLGIARDMAFAESHCLIDHYVYLAVASDLKVGVTRHNQIPTRWIDQGASYAIKLAKTPYRQLAGEMENALMKHFTDKTNWQKMLKHQVAEQIDLVQQKERAYGLLPEHLQQYMIDEDDITTINYPLLHIPKKVKSVSFDNVDSLSGTLTGIKGQYLILDNEYVFNVRKHSAYLCTFQM